MKAFAPTSAFLLAMLAAGLLSGLSGCALPPAPEQAPALRSASEAGLGNTALPASQQLPADWWTLLGDPQLDELIRIAHAQHPSIALARARSEQALALAGLNRSTQLPQARLSFEATRQLYSANDIFPPPLGGNIYDSGQLLAGVSWNLDLFDQHGAELRAALGQARAAQADRAAARTQLASQISHSYIRLAQALAQRGSLEALMEVRRQSVELSDQRVQAGLDGAQERAQMQQALDGAAAQMAELDDGIALLRHQIAVLCAQEPRSQDKLSPSLDKLHLPTLPSEPGIDMLGRRPDVVAARWRVEAALDSTDAARSAFYPNVSLSSFVGAASIGLGHLSHAGSRMWGISPAVSLPLFDAGRLQAQWGVRQAELQSAVASYNQTLLEAVRQARDALGTLESQKQRHRLQTHALQQAQLSHDLARQRQQAGLGNRLQLLGNQQQLLAQQRLVIDQRSAQLDASVSLMQALGSWNAAIALQPHTI